MSDNNKAGDASGGTVADACLKLLFQSICPQEKGTGTRDAGADGNLAGKVDIPPTLQHILAIATGQIKADSPSINHDEFRSKAASVIPAEVRMFSGCKDAQTSADVSSSAGFSLPADAGPGGAGGACTNAMLEAIAAKPETNWQQLLQDMRVILKHKNFSQVPQLSASKDMSLTSPFAIRKAGGGRTRALFIGINYVGHNPGELKGCHNDVEKMKRFVLKQGFDPANMRFLLDDGRNTPPNKAEILAALKWLVQGAAAGDSLFMHYSGHGGQLKDDSGDEADGFDETMVPLDYLQAGQIRDDDLFKELVLPLPEGALLTVVMDCCHSGSIMDLPYEFVASDANMQNGAPDALPPNMGFDFSGLVAAAIALFAMFAAGAGGAGAGAGAPAQLKMAV